MWGQAEHVDVHKAKASLRGGSALLDLEVATTLEKMINCTTALVDTVQTQPQTQPQTPQTPQTQPLTSKQTEE